MSSFDDIKERAPTFLKERFDDDVAQHFMAYIEEEELEELDEVIDDIADISSSGIIQAMSDKCGWNNQQEKTKFFHAVRVLFGLETDDDGDKKKKKKAVGPLPTEINWTQFTEDDCKETRQYINKQCFNAFSGFDQSFITIETIGRNNKINIVPLLFDIYSFHKYKEIGSNKENKLTHSQFVSKSSALKSLKLKDESHKKVYTSLVQTLASFQHRINPAFNHNYSLKIDDDINAFIQYTLNVSNMLHKVIYKSKASLNYKPPFLVDLWIIPAKVREALSVAGDYDDDDDSDDDDDDSDDEDDVKEDTMTKDFVENLKQFGATYEVSTINFQDEAKCARILEQCFKNILNKVRSSVKLNIMIDRRKDKDNLLIYQLPLKYSAINANYCNETLIYSSSEHLMYDIDNSILKRDKKKLKLDGAQGKDPIFGAKFDCDGKMFCLSFALHEADKNRIQFWRNGGGVRFWPNYMTDLWPKLFINSKINKKYLENNYIQNNFGLKVNDPLFDSWYNAIVDFDK